jgi:multidrug resistance efflux pump
MSPSGVPVLRRAIPCGGLALALVLASGAGGRVARGEPEKDAKEDAPVTVEATKGAFHATLTLDGVFDAVGAEEVAWRPATKRGNDEEHPILEVAPFGPVQAGQTLLRLDTSDVDEEIATAEADLAVARASLAQKVEEVARKKEENDAAVERAVADARRADEALSTFEKEQAPLRREQAALELERVKDSITDQKEELAQLEKMYKADDLVEETEEIVMKRAKRALERSTTSLGHEERSQALLLRFELPREEEALRLDRRKTAAEADLARATASATVAAAEADLAKERLDLGTKEKALGKLRKDREGMTLKAPAAGVALPGPLARGHWTSPRDTAQALRVGGRAGPNSVYFTIVKPGAVEVLSSIEEGSVLDVKAGTSAVVVPTALPAVELPARVAEVRASSVDGKFDVRLTLSTPDERLLPGFGCEVRVDLGERADAITVPKSAVGEKDGKHVVHVATAGGKSEAKVVVVGPTSDGRTQILKGLSGGEKVLETAPKED